MQEISSAAGFGHSGSKGDQMRSGLALNAVLAAGAVAHAAEPRFPSSAGDISVQTVASGLGASLVARIFTRWPHAGNRAARAYAHCLTQWPIVPASGKCAEGVRRRDKGGCLT